MADLEVFVENHLAEKVHVCAVRHSPRSIEFVISRERLPIPSGEPHHFDVEPGHALALRNVPMEVQFSLTLRDWGESVMRMSHEQGFDKGKPYMRIRLLPPEDAAPEGPPDPNALN